LFDGPKKFFCCAIRLNERKSYDQVTQQKNYVGELFTWKKKLHAGTIRACDAQTDKYSVLSQNGNTVEWELEQVCKTWGKGNDQQQWSQIDQEALGCLVLRVQGHVVSNTSHTLCTPFPTLL
jgi:hypothetical protein